MGRFLVGAAAGSKGPPRFGERRRGSSEHAPSAQFGNVGQVDAGEDPKTSESFEVGAYAPVMRQQNISYIVEAVTSWYKKR
ncbi:hypothetical protein AB0942_32590 [Streptomyces nodosus]|uniref:hypothetical protein n=1 Tax=Streptomyces nodosus TaxID=40318 RepID=UPI003451A42B